MDQVQMRESPARARWDIDRRLEMFAGQDVRVAVECFSPVRWNGEALPSFIHVRDLILPDNSVPGALPVFFEGRLLAFQRRIGVVYASLDAPASSARSAEGIVPFRGRAVVILRGPATVVLAFPFRVEPLPPDPDNYWEDLRIATAQFRLQLP